MTLTTVTPPAALAVDLTVLKSEYLRVFDDSEDNKIQLLVEAATRAIEIETSLRLITQTVKQTFTSFNYNLRLEVRPVQSITSVVYKDIDGNDVALSASEYHARLDKNPPLLAFKENFNPPSLDYDYPDPVAVTYVVGYGASHTDVEASLKVCIMSLVANNYQNPEPTSTMPGQVAVEIPKTFDYLLEPYRTYRFG